LWLVYAANSPVEKAQKCQSHILEQAHKARGC